MSTAVLFGIPQWSVLGPSVFLLYTAYVHAWTSGDTWLKPHLYVDDSQIYSFCRPGDNEQLKSRVSVRQ